MNNTTFTTTFLGKCDKSKGRKFYSEKNGPNSIENAPTIVYCFLQLKRLLIVFVKLHQHLLLYM